MGSGVESDAREQGRSAVDNIGIDGGHAALTPSRSVRERQPALDEREDGRTGRHE